MLFGIDYARQAIWRKRQQEIKKARAEGREEGYTEGYNARTAEENEHETSANQRPVISK